MKKCPECGRIENDEINFCRKCGKKLEQVSEENEEPKSGRKKIWIIAIVLILIALVIGSFWLFQDTSSNNRYAETMKMAENYLIDEDYQRAEETYLLAKEIDPAQREPYEQLYTIYTIQKETEKAENIYSEALENITEEDIPAFEDRIIEIQDEFGPEPEPEPELEVVAELGELDMAPFTLDGEKWYYSKNNQLFVLKPDGSNMEIPESLSMMVLGYSDGGTMACLDGDVQTVSRYSGSLGNEIVGCGVGGAIDDYPFYLDSSNQIVLSDLAQAQKNNASSEVYEITEPIVISHTHGDLLAPVAEQGEYYIYNNVNQELYGPYSEGQIGSFYVKIYTLSGGTSFGLIQNVTGPFWVLDDFSSKNSEVTLFSHDGTRMMDGFTRASTIDPLSIGAYEDDLYSLYDEDLNLLYSGKYEEGGYPIQGIAPIKQDGIWKLVQISQENS